MIQGAKPGGHLRLFIVHAPEDAWFVEGYLIEALGLPNGEVLVSSQLEPGAVVVNEIERGALSPVTVVVASPAFLASPWAQFANQLAMHQSVESLNDGSSTLISLILFDCELSLLSRVRVYLDFRHRAHWEAEVAKLREKLVATAPTTAVVPCPYPGIRPFTERNADHFHGRDREVRELLGRLRDGQRELYVIGPSGSGKSSLVAAGVVPRLRRWPELAGGTFLVRQMRPGGAPIASLAGVLEVTVVERDDVTATWVSDAVGRLLTSHAGDDRLLIVVDQLEELFIIAKNEARAAFIAAMRILRSDARVVLLLVLRADFYSSLMESAMWADLDGQLVRLDVSPLRGERLRAAIELPARAHGVYFEPVLVERLLHEVADEPGALPLLQDTLLELWARRTRGLLRLTEYEAMSDSTHTGLAVTVARRADGALNELSRNQRDIARRVLLRLIQFGDGATTTRRQQTRAALATGDAPEDIDAVLRHLAERRLITISGGDALDPSVRVDLAHEALLLAWPTLGEWIRSRQEDELHRRTLEAKAIEWVRNGRGQFRLLDADELREVRGWLSDEKARDLGISEEICSLLAASEAEHARAQAEKATMIARLVDEQQKTRTSIIAAVQVADEIVFEVDDKLRNLAGAAPVRELLLARSRSLFQQLRTLGRLEVDAQRTEMVAKKAQAKLAFERGRFDEAMQLFREVHDHAHQQATADPTNSTWQLDLSLSYEKLGDIAEHAGKLDDARTWFHKYLAVAKALANADPHNHTYQYELSVACEKLGDVAISTRRFEDAMNWFEQSLATRKALTDVDPKNTAWRRDLSVSYNKSGDLAVSMDNQDLARMWFEKALRIRVALVGGDPSNTAWQRDLSVSYERLGHVTIAAGQRDDARSWFKRSLEVRRMLACLDPSNPGWQRDLCVTLTNIALLTQEPDVAQRYHDEARTIYDKLHRDGFFLGDIEFAQLGAALGLRVAPLVKFQNRAGTVYWPGTLTSYVQALRSEKI